MKSFFRLLNKKVSHLLLLAAGKVYRFSTFALVAVGLMLSASKNIGSDVPDKRRFTKVVLTENLNEPMEMTFLPTGELIFIERKGAVKMLNSSNGKVIEVGNIAVSTQYTSLTGRKSEAEDGLIGIVTDPDFQTNHWLYFYYSPQGDEAKNVIARYELKDNQINQESKRIILEIPTQRQECCHTGGGMVFDAAKNLYISTGDNTSPRATMFAPIDERPGKSPFDAQKSSANTNDLRGKIIRIHPEPDGSYTIPEGNLFLKGMEKTRPEIYTMGHRNPWRLSIDSKTGYLYWGEVGPDASNDSTGFGPKGYDEFNQARKAGNFGWPLVIADNKPYWSVDFETKKPRYQINPDKPVNNSPNNTGLTTLPAAQKAFIWYPYSVSDEFPALGTAGRSATGGPVFRMADFKNGKRPFPSYYEGKWFITDFMRGWIMTVTMDEQNNYKSMERFLPDESIGSAIDLKFSPDGDLYVLEYGSAWFKGNANARIVRFEYNAGNLRPVAKASVDKTAGSLPLKVQLSSKGTVDYDRDVLRYTWKVTREKSQNLPRFTQQFNQPEPVVTLTAPGSYKATLTVTDSKGLSDSKTIDIVAGNAPPMVDVQISDGNQSFFLAGKPLNYQVVVTDKEDGSLKGGRIVADQVAFTADYLPEGYDRIEAAQSHRRADSQARFALGEKLVKNSDCMACHQTNVRSVGPGFTEIAQKYQSKDMTASLAQKIIKGGNGVWGDHAMSAHPQLSQRDAVEMVKYILSFDGSQKSVKGKTKLPLAGQFVAEIPKDENGNGAFLLRAAYRDLGAKGAPNIESEKVILLRNPVVPPVEEEMDEAKNVQFISSWLKSIRMLADGAYVGLQNIDLNTITSIQVSVSTEQSMAGGKIQVRLDKPDGQLIGESEPFVAGKPLPAKKLKIALSEVKGLHTVYLIGINGQARPYQPLTQINRISFETL